MLRRRFAISCTQQQKRQIIRHTQQQEQLQSKTSNNVAVLLSHDKPSNRNLRHFSTISSRATSSSSSASPPSPFQLSFNETAEEKRRRRQRCSSSSSRFLELRVPQNVMMMSTTSIQEQHNSSSNNKAIRSSSSTRMETSHKDDKEKNNGTIEENASSSSLTGDTFMRLLELSKPEWNLIAWSAATLLVTSSVTLLLPYASGSVIDYSILASSTADQLPIDAIDGSSLPSSESTTTSTATATTAATTTASATTSPVVMAMGLFGMSALTGGGVYLRTLWLAQAGNRIVARLKQQLYSRMLQQELAYYDLHRYPTGDLLSRLTADAQLVQTALTTQVIAGLRGTVMSIGSAGMLFYTSPTLAAMSASTLPLIFILTRWKGRQLAQEQQEVQKQLGEATTVAEQSLSSLATVQQFNAQQFESVRFHNAIAKAHSKAVDTSHLQAQMEGGAHLAANAVLFGVLGYGGTMVMDGSITAGDLTGFVMYSLLLAGNLSGLTSVYSDIVRATAASQRILEIMDREPEITGKIDQRHGTKSINATNDPVVPRLLPSGKDDNPLVPINYHDLAAQTIIDVDNTNEVATATDSLSIDIQNVNFAYPSRSDIQVLNDFNLTAHPGEVIALVGGSGSGKSTIAALLTRLYDYNYDNDDNKKMKDDGDHNNNENNNNDVVSSISIFGRRIEDYDPYELRQLIGIVSQDPVLFQGTIRDNIRYGSWDDNNNDDDDNGKVTNEQIEHAANQAHVTEFVKTFPDGFDTYVGPKGMQLSGGQRQRIALARVLAKNPPIIILDEATSALDARSEHLVQQALQALFEENMVQDDEKQEQQQQDKRRTIISIAHRLSTIRHSSRVAVIQDGTVVQMGTFDELQQIEGGAFRELMKTQLVGTTTTRTRTTTTTSLKK